MLPYSWAANTYDRIFTVWQYVHSAKHVWISEQTDLEVWDNNFCLKYKKQKNGCTWPPSPCTVWLGHSSAQVIQKGQEQTEVLYLSQTSGGVKSNSKYLYQMKTKRIEELWHTVAWYEAKVDRSPQKMSFNDQKKKKSVARHFFLWCCWACKKSICLVSAQLRVMNLGKQWTVTKEILGSQYQLLIFILPTHIQRVFRDFLFAMTSYILLLCCFLLTNLFTLSFKHKTDNL